MPAYGLSDLLVVCKPWTLTTHCQQRVSTRCSAPLTLTERPSLVAGSWGAFTPAPLPFGENGGPGGSASWSRPKAAKVGQCFRQSSNKISSPAPGWCTDFQFFARIRRQRCRIGMDCRGRLVAHQSAKVADIRV